MDGSDIPKQRFTDSRLKKPPAEKFKKYITLPGLESEKKFFNYMSQVNMAHVIMLAEEKIIHREDAKKILTVQKEIEELGVEEFPIDLQYGSLYLQFESYFIDKLGEDVAGKMHTGRSRADLHGTIARLFTKDKLLFVIEKLIAFQKSLLNLAEKHVDTIMPGYTHMQHAEPWTLGHYLTSMIYMFERDFDRLKGAYKHADLSPLGARVNVGTSWPLNRERTAELLGFDDIVVNARENYSGNLDFVLEAVGVNSILMNNLSRLCGDLFIWSTSEFNMLELADEYAGTSSAMPQKKNPYPFEMTRVLAGQAIGWVSGVLGAFKTATSSDGDIAFWDFKTCGIPDCTEKTANMLDLIAGVLDTLIVHEDVMRERAGAFWGTALNLADVIVRETGISFRSAHHVVGRTVRLAYEAGIQPSEVKGELLDKAASQVINRGVGLSTETVQNALDPVKFINSLVTVGCSNPREVAKMIKDCKSRVKKEEEWLNQRKAKLKKAKKNLNDTLEIIKAV